MCGVLEMSGFKIKPTTFLYRRKITTFLPNKQDSFDENNELQSVSNLSAMICFRFF